MNTWIQFLSPAFAVFFLTIGMAFSLWCAFSVLRRLYLHVFGPLDKTADVPVAVTLKSAPNPKTLGVSPMHDLLCFWDQERANAETIGYPEHWDTAAYPTVQDAIHEILSCNYKDGKPVDFAPPAYRLNGDVTVKPERDGGLQLCLTRGDLVYLSPVDTYGDPEIMAARRAALGMVEVLGTQCADGGKCHHECGTACFRKAGCEPLSAAKWLNTDWSLKK